MMKELMITTFIIGALAILVFSARPDSDVSDSEQVRVRSSLGDQAHANSMADAEQLQSQLAKAESRIRKLEQELTESLKKRTQEQNVARTPDEVPQPCQEQSPIDFETIPPETAGQDESIDPVHALEVENTFIDLESDYWQEPLNDQWTANTRTELEDSLAEQSIPDTSLDLVECHDTLCLVEFVHSKPEGHEILLQRLRSMTVFSDGFLVKTDESSGDIHTLVYVPEKGNSLPLAIQPLMKGEL